MLEVSCIPHTHIYATFCIHMPSYGPANSLTEVLNVTGEVCVRFVSSLQVMPEEKEEGSSSKKQHK